MENNALGGYARRGASMSDGKTEAAVMEPPNARSLSKSANCDFAGRIGGNQVFVLDRENDGNAEILKQQPDAAPGMSLGQQFDVRPFRSIGLWKAAMIEGIGKRRRYELHCLLHH